MAYSSIKDDRTLIEALSRLSEEHPTEGFWKSYFRLRNAGERINHKRLHRVYKDMGLPLRRKSRRRLPARVKETMAAPGGFAETWSMDFMSDALGNGRKFRSFNVIDDYNRELLFIETDFSIKSSRVIWVLNHLVNKHGRPKKIRMDNGPEFVAVLAQQWSKAHGIEFKYIQPGKPTQNAFIERFNKTYREKVLDAYYFDTLDEVRQAAEDFMEDYNHHRPHDALNGMAPVMWKYGQQAGLQGKGIADHIPTINNDFDKMSIFE